MKKFIHGILAFLFLSACSDRQPIAQTESPFYTRSLTLLPGKAHYKEIFAEVYPNGYEVTVKSTSALTGLEFRVMRVADYKAFREQGGPAPVLLVQFRESDLLAPRLFKVPPGDYYFSVFNSGPAPSSFTVEYKYLGPVKK